MRLIAIIVSITLTSTLNAQERGMFKRVDKDSLEQWSTIHNRIGQLWDPASKESQKFANTVKKAQSEGYLTGEAEVKQLAAGLVKDYSDEYSKRIDKMINEIAAKTNYRISYQVPRDNEYARALYIHRYYEELSAKKSALMAMPRAESERRAVLVAKYSDNKAYVESFKSNFAAADESGIAPEFFSKNKSTDFVISAKGDPLGQVFRFSVVNGNKLGEVGEMYSDGMLENPRIVRDEANKYFITYDFADDVKVKVKENGKVIEEKTYAKGDLYQVEVNPPKGADPMPAFTTLYDYNKQNKFQAVARHAIHYIDSEEPVDGWITLIFPLATGFSYERHVTSGDEAETGVYILDNGVMAYPKKPADVTKEEARSAKLIMVHDIGSLPAVVQQAVPEKKPEEIKKDLKKFIDGLGFKDGIELIPAQNPCEFI